MNEIPHPDNFEQHFERVRAIILENIESDYSLTLSVENPAGYSSINNFIMASDEDGELLAQLSTYAQTAVKDHLRSIAATINSSDDYEFTVELKDVWVEGNLIDIEIHYGARPDKDVYGQAVEETTGNEELKQYEFISNKELEFSTPHICTVCKQKVESKTAIYQGKKPEIKKNKRGKPFSVDFDMHIEHCKDKDGDPAWVVMTHRFEADTKAEVQEYIESLRSK